MRKVLYMMGQLSDDDIEWMIESGAPRQLRPGDVLIREGQPVAALYIVLEGALAVSAAGRGEIARLEAGEIIGEISFVDARPPATTVTALVPAVVFALDRERLRGKLERDAWFAARFYRSVSVFLAARLRNTVGQLGYGTPAPRALADDERDEIDESVLDNVHLAGARFDRMLKRFVG
jgi:CRP-like cAMP-binding protein